MNCLHVLDEPRPLEEKWADELVVIGVHSPKFEFEKDPEAAQANIERYEVSHPVIDDPELETWSAYGARAWPTLMVLDTHGRIAGNLSGEGHAANLDRLVAELVAEGEADGSLRRGPAPTVLAERSEQTLRFPSKLAVLPDGRLVVSDAGQHRLVVFQADGATVDAIIGTGERGHADGDEDTAQFAEPNGVLALPAEVAQEVGYDLLVADTAGHCLRGVKIGQDRLLRSRTTTEVVTVAGTGEQWMQGEPRRARRGRCPHLQPLHPLGPHLEPLPEPRRDRDGRDPPAVDLRPRHRRPAGPRGHHPGGPRRRPRRHLLVGAPLGPRRDARRPDRDRGLRVLRGAAPGPADHAGQHPGGQGPVRLRPCGRTARPGPSPAPARRDRPARRAHRDRRHLQRRDPPPGRGDRRGRHRRDRPQGALRRDRRPARGRDRPADRRRVRRAPHHLGACREGR
ncbi:hypothetical protein [Brachybacterium sp. GPGPB12]|uniref:hypothetical protein n=1 Tax=Brachybacterium sp. GPGPB12 TaxID=3023517 RepID=UPI003134608F